EGERRALEHALVGAEDEREVEAALRRGPRAAEPAAAARLAERDDERPLGRALSGELAGAVVRRGELRVELGALAEARRRRAGEVEAVDREGGEPGGGGERRGVLLAVSEAGEWTVEEDRSERARVDPERGAEDAPLLRRRAARDLRGERLLDRREDELPLA